MPDVQNSACAGFEDHGEVAARPLVPLSRFMAPSYSAAKVRTSEELCSTVSVQNQGTHVTRPDSRNEVSGLTCVL